MAASDSDADSYASGVLWRNLIACDIRAASDSDESINYDRSEAHAGDDAIVKPESVLAQIGREGGSLEHSSVAAAGASVLEAGDCRAQAHVHDRATERHDSVLGQVGRHGHSLEHASAAAAGDWDVSSSLGNESDGEGSAAMSEGILSQLSIPSSPHQAEDIPGRVTTASVPAANLEAWDVSSPDVEEDLKKPPEAADSSQEEWISSSQEEQLACGSKGPAESVLSRPDRSPRVDTFCLSDRAWGNIKGGSVEDRDQHYNTSRPSVYILLWSPAENRLLQTCYYAACVPL